MESRRRQGTCVWAYVFLELGNRENTEQNSLAETQTPQHNLTNPLLLEPLRRLLGGEESFRFCATRTRTTEGTPEYRINPGLLGIPVLARPGLSGFVWDYLLP